MNSDEKSSSNMTNRANNIYMTAPDAKVMTVFEHQRLTALDFVHVSDFHWLMAQEFTVFTIKRKQRQWQLKIGHYIGVILLPSDITLEILPKPIASNESTRAQRQPHSYKSAQNSDIEKTRQWVQHMLSDLINSHDHSHNKLPNTKNLGQFSNQLTLLPIAAASTLPLSDWLLRQFLQRLNHHQPTKHYQPQTYNQVALQGRLLIKEQLRYNSMQPHKFFCESSVLSQDMLGNRLIKKALTLLTPLLPELISPKLLQAWQQVPTLTHHEMQQVDAIYNQAKRQLAIQPLQAQKRQVAQQLVDMAYWLLRQSTAATGHSIDPQKPFKQNSSQLRLCLLIDMNQAFEQWASERIASMFTQVSGKYRPLYQTQRVWLSDTQGQARLSIRPDLLIYKIATDEDSHHYPYTTSMLDDPYGQGKYSHVIDIKWKHLSHAAAISASDAYQLTSYAQAYQAGQVWLVYPVQDDERPPIALIQQTDSANNADNGPKHAQLWLVPFNVMTGTINSGSLRELNVI
ncbi:hypothetical protein M917_1832 [Psychrobacter aquaticus CMS 56]|uniref:McrBC 5-methylcytosine restriction system component n=2 Tax=Psychrobacter TaxID=497 RepID=U4TA00_9GAMM|nr:hypothetical protein M917_1832 [Psychrobacter aquaticus CMS 56]